MIFVSANAKAAKKNFLLQVAGKGMGYATTICRIQILEECQTSCVLLVFSLMLADLNCLPINSSSLVSVLHIEFYQEVYFKIIWIFFSPI